MLNLPVLSAYSKEFKYNIDLATPVILGMLGHTFVGLIDNIMVGQLGSAELAAVSLGNSFIFIAMSLGIGFSTAITPLVAEAHSANEFAQGKSSFKHGLFLCTLISLFLFLGILFSKPLMSLMNQPDEVVDLAKPYLDIVAFSLIPLIIFQAFKQFSDGLSMTKYPMYATITANVINVVLNYILIFGSFGAPKLGIVGAAIGTLISRLVMLFFLWILLGKNEKSKAFVTNIKFLVLENKMIKKLCTLGIPSAAQMFFEVAIFTAAIWLSGLLGKNAQAANQIALNLSSMTFMVAMGLSVAAMVRVGNQKGLKDYERLRLVARSIFLLGLLLASLFAITFFLFRHFLPTIYVDFDELTNINDSKEVVSIASKLLLIAAIFQIFDSLQVIALGALRGMQDVKVPTLITFFAYWLVGFPISYYLGKEAIMGSEGIWVGLLAGLTTAAVLLYFRFEYLTKRLILRN